MKILKLVLFPSLLLCAEAATRRLEDDCLMTQILGQDVVDLGGDAVFISANGNVLATGDPARVFEYSTETNMWEPLGENSLDPLVTGQAHALSADGRILAANFVSGNAPTEVRVVEYSESFLSWTQRGGSIVSTMSSELELSADGRILAVGDSNGVIRVFEYDVEQVDWTQIGRDISGSQAGLENLALSGDGQRVALVGLPSSGLTSVRVFQYIPETGWTQLGQDITGGLEFGHALAISADGSSVAVSDATFFVNNLKNGQVQVYRLSPDEEWVQMGGNIDGETSEDNAGSSVSLSEDGTILAVGANGNNGRVRLYTIDANSTLWTQIGETLVVDQEVPGNHFGSAVALTPDGSTLIANTIDVTMNNNDTAVRVFSLSHLCPTAAPSMLQTSAPSPSGSNASSIGLGPIAGIVAGAALLITIAGFFGRKWCMTKQQQITTKQQPISSNSILQVPSTDAGSISVSGILQPIATEIRYADGQTDDSWPHPVATVNFHQPTVEATIQVPEYKDQVRDQPSSSPFAAVVLIESQKK